MKVWESVLKELWESWKVCHCGMIEVTEKNGYCSESQVLGRWCDELMKMVMWIVENVEMECDDEIDGIVDMLFGRRKSK